MSGYIFEKHSGYCTLRFTPDLAKMEWNDIQAATGRVTELVAEAKTSSILVDLTQLETMPSGVVASLVQTWQGMDEQNRRFVVVSSSDEVTSELKQTGLTDLWTLSTNLNAACRQLGIMKMTDMEIDSVDANSIGDPASQTPSNEPIEFTGKAKYCSLVLNPVLTNMDWGGVEEATTRTIESINETGVRNVMVDLSRMDIIHSSLVATLVRIWQSTDQDKSHFAVVSPNEQVTQVLKAAGLLKLWNVVDSSEDAVYELGASVAAQVERGALQIQTLVALPCAILAGVATIVMLFWKTEVLGVNAQLMALILGSGALTTGLIAVWKDTGLNRKISIVSVIIACLVLSTLWFKDNPIAFGHKFPDRNLGRERDDEDDPNESSRDQSPDPESNNGNSNESEGQTESDKNTEQRKEVAGQETTQQSDSEVSTNRLGDLMLERMRSEKNNASD